MPDFVIFAPLCNFFPSLCNLQATPLCNYTAPLCNHKKLLHFVIIFPHFVIICKINLGIFLYIFDSLAIFPRKSNHGEDDRHILNFRSLTVEKRKCLLNYWHFSIGINTLYSNVTMLTKLCIFLNSFHACAVAKNTNYHTKNQLFWRQQKRNTVSIKKLYLTNLSKFYTNW